jgi:hypothetical protein
LQDASFQVRADPSLGHHVNFAAEEVFEILFKPDLIEKATTRLEVHKDIDVTIGPCLAAGHGAEQPNPADAVPLREPKNGLTVLANLVEPTHGT